MIDWLSFIWENTKRTLYAVIKWFVIAFVARLAFAAGIAVLLIPPALVWGFADGFGLPLVVSVPLGILGFVAAAVGFGMLLDRIDPMLTFDTPD